MIITHIRTESLTDTNFFLAAMSAQVNQGFDLSFNASVVYKSPA